MLSFDDEGGIKIQSFDEQRMDVIGQNGNTGEHYKQLIDIGDFVYCSLNGCNGVVTNLTLCDGVLNCSVLVPWSRQEFKTSLKNLKILKKHFEPGVCAMEKDSMNKRSMILHEANVLINGKNNEAPQQDFQMISKLWSEYLEVEISCEDVAMLMILLKMANHSSCDSKDENLINIAGYAALAAEIIE